MRTRSFDKSREKDREGGIIQAERERAWWRNKGNVNMMGYKGEGKWVLRALLGVEEVVKMYIGLEVESET